MCLAALLTAAAFAGAGQSPTVEQAFARYRAGDRDVVAALDSITAADAALRELDRFGPKYLSGDRATAEERRRWLMTFVLELAQAQSEKESVSAGLLVEWACRHVRRHEPIDEFDRRWQLAATALLAGAINPGALDAHLRHMAARHPGEPRLALARALVADQYTAPREVLARSRAAAAAASTQAALPSLQEEAARRFQELALLDERLRAEANVRRARVYIALKRFDDAIVTLAPVESQTTDRTLIYLSRLFRGQALERLGRTEEAQREWVSALKIAPGAQSAMMSLATAMFRAGERTAADLVVSRMLETNDPRADPWWAYWAGDYRFWYQLVAEVRELLR